MDTYDYLCYQHIIDETETVLLDSFRYDITDIKSAVRMSLKWKSYANNFTTENKLTPLPFLVIRLPSILREDLKCLIYEMKTGNGYADS